MQILVTGAAGFIGSHLVEALLRENHTVCGVDNLSVGRMENLELASKSKLFSFHQIDITSSTELNSIQGDFDIVLHLAALADIVPSIEQPEEYFETNVTGTLRIVQLARKLGAKKLVYIASSSCYGIPESFPTPETAEIRPKYPYALTKYLGEQIALHWSEVYKLPVTSLRFFNVYGPRARTSGTYGAVFGVFMAQKLANLPFTVVGDGEQTRDFTYVTDVVDAIITAMNSEKSGVYNVGSGNTYSINYLVSLLGGSVTYIPKRPGEPNCTFADIKKIRSELNWAPKITFEKGVSKMLENLAYWEHAPIWSPASIESATHSWFKFLGEEK